MNQMFKWRQYRSIEYWFVWSLGYFNGILVDEMIDGTESMASDGNYSHFISTADPRSRRSIYLKASKKTGTAWNIMFI